MRSQRVGALVAVMVLGFSVGALAFSGSSSDPFPQTAPARASRTVPPRVGNGDRVDIADPPFHFVAPHSWKSFDLTTEKLDTVARLLAPTNPTFAKFFNDAMRSLLAKNARFFAADPSNGDNLTVLVAPGVLSLAMIDAVRSQFARVPGITGLSVRRTTIAGHQAVRVSYEVTLNGPNGGRITARGDQVYVESAHATVILTVTAFKPDNGETADAIFRSITIPTAA